MGQLLIVRGLPGSGKTTFAKMLAHKARWVHREADQYFEKDGIYRYEPEKIREAHDWCVSETRDLLEQGKKVIVSNTFVKIWEIKRYIDLGFGFFIVEKKGDWRNIHGIPDEKIQFMKKNWERLPADWILKAVPEEKFLKIQAIA